MSRGGYVDVGQQTSPFDVSDHPIRIHGDRVHPAQVDGQSPVGKSLSGNLVTTAPYRGVQSVRAGHVHSSYHVSGAPAAKDELRFLAHHCVPHHAALGVVRMA